MNPAAASPITTVLTSPLGNKPPEVKIYTEHLFVLFDAGETAALVPVLEEVERQKSDFRVLVMATAEDRVAADKFIGKRLTLKNLGIDESFSSTTRTIKMSQDSLSNVLAKIHAKNVIVGIVSQPQRQICKAFRLSSPETKTFVYADMFGYDVEHPSFNTVKRVQAVAHVVLCPGSKVIENLSCDEYSMKKQQRYPREYQVVGKPSLETWNHNIDKLLKEGTEGFIREKRERIEKVKGLLDAEKNEKQRKEWSEALDKLTFEIEQLEHTQEKLRTLTKRVVTLVGGYGREYDVITPLFDTIALKLKELGYEVFNQMHPALLKERNEKAYITTEQAMALSKMTNGFVVGYNSSVILESNLIGLYGIYFTPQEAPAVNIFTLKDRLMPCMTNVEMLLSHIQKPGERRDLRKELAVPENSLEMILKAIKA